MSVVVWDGRYIAADRMAVNGEMGFLSSKLKILVESTVLSHLGDTSIALSMEHWYENGQKPEDWPQQDKDNWARLIIISRPFANLMPRAVYYENHPKPIKVEQVPMAWGAGRDFAIGALSMGADAIKAVQVTNRFCVSCGLGVEAYDFLNNCHIVLNENGEKI